MIGWEVLSELMSAGAAGGGPEELARVLERLPLECYAGLFASQEPAGYRVLLSGPVRAALGDEGETEVARRLSELLGDGSEEPSETGAGADALRLELDVEGGPRRQFVVYPIREGEVTLGGVLANPVAASEAASLSRLLSFIRVLLSRSSLEAETRAHEKALDFLNEVYRANLEQQDAAPAMGVESTLSRLADLFHFDAAALALPDGERWKVLYWLATDSPAPFVEAVQAQTVGWLGSSQAAPPGSLVQSLLWQHRPPPAGDEPKSIFMLPLLFDPHGRRPGVLGLYSASEDLLTPSEMRLLVLLTPGLSIAFRNSQLLFALERQAKIDEMSGLYNYRTFRALLGREFKRLDRFGTPLSLLLLDVDHFKQVNDTLGHQKGDEVLRALAGVLLASKRGVDAVARYGGEEFVVILPETDGEGAAQVAERVRRQVASESILPDRPLTVSIGVATATAESPGTDDALIHRADQALYRAKRAGRNRYEVG